MSLPRYAEYRDSGIPWVGEVPAHWQVLPLFGVASERSEPNIGMKEDNLLSLSYGRIVRKDIESNDGLLPESFETYQVIRAGDIVLRLTDLQNDKRSLRSALVGEKGIITSAYLAIRPSRVDSRFLAYLLRGYDLRKVFYSMGGGLRQSMKFSDMKRMPVPLPSNEEQTAIAAFLDRETAKIDALIAEQEKLIALLAEKRQATISHAVTKGLNTDAPMKDSGVAWLGEVPAHWQVKKLRHIANVVRGASPRPAGDPEFFASDNESGLNCPWVTVAEVTKDDSMYLTEVAEYLTPAGVERSQSFASGTLIFTNSGATLGVPKILSVNCCANDGILAFKQLSSDVEIRFLYLFLLSTTERLRTEMKQGGGQPNLNTGIVKDISFALPSRTEQREILDYVETRLGRFDTLRAEAARAIALLAERRSALIAAAVTGKIDVRCVTATTNNIREELTA